MVEIENLKFSQGPFTLHIDRLFIQAHRSHALLGPSGAGKSTLLHLLLGLKTPQQGEIKVQKNSITHLPPNRRNFGYVPQHLALFPHLRVKDNILYPLKAQKKSPDTAFLDELFALSGLRPLLERHPKNLSGGERQRVALIRALAAKPKLLLLDEPFSALDPSLKEELWELLQRLQKELELTILLITHNLQEAFVLSHHCSVLIDGSIAQSAKTPKLFYRPQKLSVAKYLGFNNIFEAIGVEKGIYLPDFGQTFRSDLTLPKNQKSFVALHPKDIEPSKRGLNDLKGRVEIIERYRYKLKKFWPNRGKKWIEIERTKGEWIHLPPSAFFLVD